MSFLDTITPDAMRARFAALCEERPDIRVTSYLLQGTEFGTEWIHSVGVATDAGLRKFAPPLPPPALRGITAAPEEEVFLWTGARDLSYFLKLYREHAGAAPAVPNVLDFGCGCGRLTRFLGLSGDYRAFGCDANPDHVKWCAENLRSVDTRLNQTAPPLPFDDGQMHLVYALSVFTHLTRQRAADWLNDLARVLCPGGILILTTHGRCALDIIKGSTAHQKMFSMSADEASQAIEQISAGEYVYRPYGKATLAQANLGNEYGNSFTDGARAAQWEPFELLACHSGGLRHWQDAVVLRKR